MSERPDSITTARAKPTLVIFEDNGKLLQSLTEKFTQLGYDVTPVYVSDGTYDHVIQDGRFKRGPAKPTVSDWREQDKQLTPESSLDRTHAEAKERLDAGHRRYGLEVDMLEGMLALPEHARAITNENEVRQLLAELKPDCVLSDLEMRRAGEKNAKNTLMGDDVMRVAHETCPEAVRALHSSLYSFYNQESFADAMHGSFKDDYEAALRDAGERGYLIASKDTNPMGDAAHSAQHATVLDSYFRRALADGTPPRIVMGEAVQR